MKNKNDIVKDPSTPVGSESPTPQKKPKKKKKGKAKTVILIIVGVLLFLAAIFTFLYPLISNYLNQQSKTEVISEYSEQVEAIEDNSRTEMLAEAKEYNATLVPGSNTEEEYFTEEMLKAAAESYYQLLNVTTTGMMGYIEIPEIDIYLPMFHGTSEEVLEFGIGHILGTSLPVGGESVHTVLSGHSGLAQDRMFSDLEQMEIGDVFYLHVLDETLAYQVCEITVVLPEDVSLLSVEKGRDLCTLVTCTPFGVNTHRLLVTGERIPFEKAEEVVLEAKEDEAIISVNTWGQEYLKGVLIGIGVIVAFILIVLIVNKTKKNKAKQAKAAKAAVVVVADKNEEEDEPIAVPEAEELAESPAAETIQKQEAPKKSKGGAHVRRSE